MAMCALVRANSAALGVAHRLRFADELARLQLIARLVLAAQEAGHGGRAWAGGRHEGGAPDFGLVAQAVFEDLGFFCWLTHTPDFTMLLARMLLAHWRQNRQISLLAWAGLLT